MRRNRLQVKGWEMIIHTNVSQMREQVPCSYHIKQTLSKKLMQDKEGHYIMIEGLVHQEDVKIINTYAPKTRVEVAVEMRNRKIIVDFSTPLLFLYY